MTGRLDRADGHLRRGGNPSLDRLTELDTIIVATQRKICVRKCAAGVWCGSKLAINHLMSVCLIYSH